MDDSPFVEGFLEVLTTSHFWAKLLLNKLHFKENSEAWPLSTTAAAEVRLSREMCQEPVASATNLVSNITML